MVPWAFNFDLQFVASRLQLQTSSLDGSNLFQLTSKGTMFSTVSESARVTSSRTSVHFIQLVARFFLHRVLREHRFNHLLNLINLNMNVKINRTLPDVEEQYQVVASFCALWSFQNEGQISKAL